jgi:hypothetical protein
MSRLQASCPRFNQKRRKAEVVAIVYEIELSFVPPKLLLQIIGTIGPCEASSED